MHAWRIYPLCLLLVACGGAQKGSGGSSLDAEDDEGDGKGTMEVQIVEYEKKTKELMDATHQLGELRTQVDEQSRRLQVICLDYPDHEVCQPHTRFNYAREAFCSDKEFTKHVDEVVAACHQGECKQVDEAEQISRSQYMLLTQHLPHQLITFRASDTNLDKEDREDLQRFLETIDGEKGYVIIVGRASKDGSWRKNLELALGRAEKTRRFLVETLGMDQGRVGYITYGHEKMYLTELDAKRLSERKLNERQANRSALIFAYPCYDKSRAAEPPPPPPPTTPAPAY